MVSMFWLTIFVSCICLIEGYVQPTCRSAGWTGVSMKCGGRWIRTKIVNIVNIRQAGYGTYLEKTQTCDNLRAKNQPTTFMDYENTEWKVDWGRMVRSMCFPGGGEMLFFSGHDSVRQGFDQGTVWNCCSFYRVRGGWWRDDYTKVCCKGYVKGPGGTTDYDADHFANFIKVVNAGAPYAQAYAQVASAAIGAAGKIPKG